ncbi:hypothetical protein, partial [Staphylococcus aureus]
MKIGIYVEWCDGLWAESMEDAIFIICENHFARISNYQNEHFYNGEKTMKWDLESCRRCYTEEALIEAARNHVHPNDRGFP